MCIFLYNNNINTSNDRFDLRLTDSLRESLSLSRSDLNLVINSLTEIKSKHIVHRVRVFPKHNLN